VNLSQNYFGEGITVLNKRIYHLTYTSRIGFVYDADTYKNIKNFNYDPIIKEGWGLTNNNEHLILSDGTDRLYFLDAADLSKVSKSIAVKYGNDRIQNLNELEYIDGYIFANVYETNWILKIDPATGNVVGRLDLTSLCSEIRSIYPKAEALNGIAYDPKSKALLITGKYWPKAYLIRVK
jgi:glutamine cyclotransferase